MHPIFLAGLGPALTAVGKIANVAFSIQAFRDLINPKITSNRIYSTHDAAVFLKRSRKDIIALIRRGELTARKVGGNYEISGRSILRYTKGP